MDLSGLNDKQKEAVLHTEGPLLILAGAGSGKTRVLTYRIARLIEDGYARPWEIMAITFTNKAAGEMKERVQKLIPEGDQVWVATFHSTCLRILRKNIGILGYDPDFTVYDTDDQKSAVRSVIKEEGLDPKIYKVRDVLTYISMYKNEMMDPEEADREARDLRNHTYARLYALYEEKLKKNNALDFDDLLLKTVELFRQDQEVLAYYQNRYRYLMVDEYQDTNMVQFEFIRAMVATHQNIAVVGDDDQSIYRFRGADIRNILEFEDEFPNTKVVKLEQNYRSTKNILAVANEVIANNRSRKAKKLWSDGALGDKPVFRWFQSDKDEARGVMEEIKAEVSRGKDYKDFAVLYRTNGQSRLFEECCVNLNIPYRIVGGMNFYQRSEIKDLLAFAKTVASGKDDLASMRIINVPRRGIGDTSIDRISFFAAVQQISFFSACERADEISDLKGAVKKVEAFANLIHDLRKKTESMPLDDWFRELPGWIHYEDVLNELDKEQADAKLENIGSLVSKAKEFITENPDGTIVDFLNEVSLVADIDQMEQGENRALLMTMHGAKGLEFPYVYVTGMEEDTFPSGMALGTGDPESLEDERRLAYVAMTRAMQKLTLTGAGYRMTNGNSYYLNQSRFITEIPEEMLNKVVARGVPGRTTVNAPSEMRTSYGKVWPVKKETYKPVMPGYKTLEPPKKTQIPDYKIGDRVRHSRFGEGTVSDLIDEGRDYEVTVLFDDYGEKHMLAAFAKLEKL